MAIKLIWTDRNVQAVTTKIYRGDSPIDRSNLGVLTPIATLTAGEVEYLDAGVVAGQRYYYVLEVSAGADKVVSRNYEFWASPYLGPGRQLPLVGDFEHGYFGELLTSELFSADTLSAALNFTTGSIYGNGNTTTWHKFVRKGQVLFVPTAPLRTSVSWNDLYNAGLVYGVDGNGPYNAGSPVNQLRTVTKGRDSFIVRMFKGGPDNGNGLFTMPTTKVLPPVETIGSEWDDLIYPLFTFFPTTQRRLNYADKTPADLYLNSFMTQCQERINGSLTSCLVRGQRVTTIDGITDISTALTTAVPSLAWRPILELVPNFNIDLSA